MKNDRYCASPEEHDKFLSAVEQPDYLPKDKFGHPFIEAPRVVIEFYLKGAALKNFDHDHIGFFNFKGVSVYEQGKNKAPVEQVIEE